MKTMKKIVAILAVALMLCSVLPLSVMAADTYELASSIEVGDTVILVCKDKSMELNGISTSSTKYGLGVAYSSTPTGAYVLTVEAGSTSGTYSFKCPNGQYLYWTSGNSLATNATKNAKTSWKVTFSGTSVTIANANDNSRKLQWNASSPRFACYTSGQTAVQLFKKVSAPDVSACEHKNAQYEHNCQPTVCPDCKETLPALAGHTYNENVTLAPTCTTAGEKTLTCACGDVKTETINALGHTFVDGFCSVCSVAQPLEATIDFSTTNQRTEYSNSVQKWENDGLTLINNKASSTNNMGDYCKPARFYKSSQIIISFPNMTSLVIDGPASADYAWDTTLADYTFTKDNGVYTITFAEPTDSITLTAANQVRANKITATGVKACEHAYDNACDVDCNLCGETREVQHSVQHVAAVGATCAANGNIEYWYCDVCGMAWLNAECNQNTNLRAVVLPATGEHTYTNAFDTTCDVCGAERAVAGPISFIGKSISEDVNGLAMLFNVEAEGIAVKAGTFVQADFTNATYKGYKLLGVGVKASNGVSETNIEGLRMYDLEGGNAKFAFRVINIPADKLDVQIIMTPYYIVEIDGVETTIYGEAQTSSYNQVANV